MMHAKWLRGGFAARTGRTLAAMAGIAVTIVLLSSIGSFISYSGASMTSRAISGVPVDWQIQANPGSSLTAIGDALGKTVQATALETVLYADVSGFEATTGASVQQTGTGKVVGISDGYRAQFPREFRNLVGAGSGVLVAQQTAANLHVRPGDTVSILRKGQAPAMLKIDGVVDLPFADSFFQAVGLPPSAAPQAPPDNVLFVSQSQWHSLFDAQAAANPDSARFQLHARIGHGFPADPSAAYTYVHSLANNFEARVAGNALVGDNLSAKLSAVRADALYAKVLFLFLGLPGALLAILLVLFITASGEKHRRRERELLRSHGADPRRVVRLQAMEPTGSAVGGVILGSALSFLVDGLLVPLGPATLGLVGLWTAFAAVAAALLALLAGVLPSWRGARSETGAKVDEARVISKPLWKRAYLDLFALALSAVEFWRTASSGYSVVMAPEGVASISVNYEAFVGPFLLWIGGVLLALRLFEGLLSGRRRAVTVLVTPTAGALAPTVAASLSRDRGFLARGMLLVALAISFAISTSIFNTTYNRQARVDAELTNGADVMAIGTTSFAPNDPRLTALAALPGVAAMEPMQHRFAYVGKDLQDLFGIDPNTIGRTTTISDAFFANKNAKATLAMLRKQKDGILVSEETIKDYQLSNGDPINIRLQFPSDHQYHVVPFHIVGVVREFPTAPKDSFFVANSSYISQATGDPASEVLLFKAKGDPAALARAVADSLGPLGAKVNDIGSTQRVISSGMTSMDLRGLTSLELAFAVVLLAFSVGMVLALGMAERRRNFAAMKLTGAGKKQLDAFIHSETFLIFVGGATAGVVLGLGVAWMLVKVLSGVFDPPPEFLSLPWDYLAALLATALLSTGAVSIGIGRLARRNAVEEIRNLA